MTFDDVKDFKFTAAYEAYSKLFDEASTDERRALNDIISQLFEKEISYPSFYREISQFRNDMGGAKYRRTRIEGQRKRAYRREQQKKDRLKRHKR
ncbi:MAG: hypothetical protein ACE5OO_06710 [Candidatus Bathyarchaeia archaeon]